MKLIEELKWRGLVQDIMPGTAEQLENESTSGYIGFDPTSDSLHVGSLVPIILLLHFQKAGHKPVALVGGATGLIGDPSGKAAERNLLSVEVLQQNLEGIKSQLSRFLDFDSEAANKAELVNNYDWFKGIDFLDFIRDVGKHITINYMMSKDSVKKRLNSEVGISFTEFTYQLIQGYDFYWLYQNMGCKLQMGGSDQWGNITTGTELIRRKAGGEAFAFTCPLLTKSDGSKFGKSEDGNIWLDAERTSPYKFYQFWINSAKTDEDAEKWIKIFTFLPVEEIELLIAEHRQDPAKRILQHKLAEELTRFVHGDEALQKAKDTTANLFGSQNRPASELTLAEITSLDGLREVGFQKNTLTSGIDVISFLADTGIFSSRGEARKMIQNGGVSINRLKVLAINETIGADRILHDKFLLVQKGKKDYYLVELK